MLGFYIEVIETNFYCGVGLNGRFSAKKIKFFTAASSVHKLGEKNDCPGAAATFPAAEQHDGGRCVLLKGVLTAADEGERY